MTEKEFGIYLSVVNFDLTNNRHIRVGQAYFNTLYDLYPDIANEFQATRFDPFYDDRIIPAFLNHLYQMFVLNHEHA